MGITLKEIADLAGVHKSTVDKVLHNRPGVSDAKRAEIKKLLEEYHYQSNPLAKALNYQKKKQKIAIVLPKMETMYDLKVGIDSMITDFNSFNFDVEYHYVDYDAEQIAVCLKEVEREKVAGVILAPMESTRVADAVQNLNRRNIPVVLVNSNMRAENAELLCFVGENGEKSGRTMARLMEMWLQGSGKIGVISTDYFHTVIVREESFCDYIKKICGGIRVEKVIRTQETEDDVYAASVELLDSVPDLSGIYITCGHVDCLCRALEERGLAGKVKVFCFEKYLSIVEAIRNGTITCSLSPDLNGQGRQAMRILFNYLVYKKRPEEKLYYTKTEILVRENV